ncbi:hypothetical protein Glove_110g61 [Diversispora epigaea]|uniref:Uncharacterized protein n=1 Tax=Diversispora epigaea TaxID=1348612 RepID=A0A397JB98_9GLOM|nr:hypothetical protein Glove_110g61 [Diversispora epigaea]
MSNLNALFSTNSKASGSRAFANRVSTSTSRASASIAIPPCLISQSSSSFIQSFESDDSITLLSSVSNVRARSDDVLLLRRILTKIELLQKINEDNQKKLCKLGKDMKSIKEKISVLSFNKESLDVIIKKFSEKFIEHSIYPIPGDYKEMAEEVLRKTNNDFFLSLSDQWDDWQKDTKFTQQFKSPIVLECYKKLFTKIENTSEKYIVRIIKNAWPKKEFIPDSRTAWCVSIAEILLNSNNEYIQITEDVVQLFVKKNLVNNNGDDDDDYNNNNNNDYNNDDYNNNNNDYNDYNNNNNDYNNDDYNNNNNDYNDYNNNNVNNEDDFQIIEDDRRLQLIEKK